MATKTELMQQVIELEEEVEDLTEQVRLLTIRVVGGEEDDES